MTSYSSVGETLAREHLTERAVAASQQVQPSWADKYRGVSDAQISANFLPYNQLFIFSAPAD